MEKKMGFNILICGLLIVTGCAQNPQRKIASETDDDTYDSGDSFEAAKGREYTRNIQQIYVGTLTVKKDIKFTYLKAPGSSGRDSSYLVRIRNGEVDDGKMLSFYSRHFNFDEAMKKYNSYGDPYCELEISTDEYLIKQADGSFLLKKGSVFKLFHRRLRLGSHDSFALRGPHDPTSETSFKSLSFIDFLRPSVGNGYFSDRVTFSPTPEEKKEILGDLLELHFNQEF